MIDEGMTCVVSKVPVIHHHHLIVFEDGPAWLDLNEETKLYNQGIHTTSTAQHSIFLFNLRDWMGE